jgi:hypothetical protein
VSIFVVIKNMLEMRLGKWNSAALILCFIAGFLACTIWNLTRKVQSTRVYLHEVSDRIDSRTDTLVHIIQSQRKVYGYLERLKHEVDSLKSVGKTKGK